MRLDRRKLQQSGHHDKSKITEGQEDALLDQHFGKNAKKNLSELDSSDFSEEEEDSHPEGNPLSSDPSSRNNQNSIQRGIDAYRKNNIARKTYLKQKAHNYQKKRSGTGGGFIKKIDNYSKLHAKKSYNTIREKLRQQVLQDKIDFQKIGKYKKRGKWQFLDEEEEHKRRSRMTSLSKSKSKISKQSRVQKLRSLAQSQKQQELNQSDAEDEDENLEDSVEKMSLKSLSKKFNSIQVDYDGDEKEEREQEEEQTNEEVEGFENNFEEEEVQPGDDKSPVPSKKSHKSNTNSAIPIAEKQVKRKPPKLSEKKVKSPKVVSFNQPRENTATFGEVDVEETAEYTETQDVEPTQSNVIQVSDTYRVSNSIGNTPREKYHDVEDTMAYDESQTLESTVAFVTDPKKVQNPSTQQYKEDIQLEETVKYPDEDDQELKQGQIEHIEGGSSLDPTVYYGSTDEEGHNDHEMDETQQYIPTQQSMAPTEKFTQKVHFEDHSQPSHDAQRYNHYQQAYEPEPRVQIPFNEMIASRKSASNSISQSYNPEDEPIYDHLSQSYLRALELLSIDDYNAAYRMILSNQDDFYLLRLMTKTGVCWERLDHDLQAQLKTRIAEIFKSDFLTDLKSQWTNSGPQNLYTGLDTETTSGAIPNDSELKSLIGRYNRRAHNNQIV